MAPNPANSSGFGDIQQGTLRFLIHWFRGRPEIVDFWGVGGPGDPKNHSKGLGCFAPKILELFLGTPGPPRPKKLTISGRPRNHVLKTHVYSMLRNSASGPEIGMPGWISAGF
jgi:hypothetical protein